jgi:RNAse (barnase) inhibitor barstar
MDTKQSKHEQYLKTYYGQDLIKKYPLFQKGVWEVRGEDSNCDFGGSHHMPQLGFYEGTLDEVIDIAVNLPNFWQWGSGGKIEPIKITSMETANKRKQLEQKKAELLEMVSNIEEQLKGV